METSINNSTTLTDGTDNLVTDLTQTRGETQTRGGTDGLTEALKSSNRDVPSATIIAVAVSIVCILLIIAMFITIWRRKRGSWPWESCLCRQSKGSEQAVPSNLGSAYYNRGYDGTDQDCVEMGIPESHEIAKASQCHVTNAEVINEAEETCVSEMHQSAALKARVELTEVKQEKRKNGSLSITQACAMIYNQEPEERDSGYRSGASTLTIMPTPHLSMIADYIAHCPEDISGHSDEECYEHVGSPVNLNPLMRQPQIYEENDPAAHVNAAEETCGIRSSSTSDKGSQGTEGLCYGMSGQLETLKTTASFSALDLGVCTSNGLIAEVITLASTGSRQDNFNQISTHKLDQCSDQRLKAGKGRENQLHKFQEAGKSADAYLSAIQGMIEHCKNVTKLGVYCETECIAIGRFGPEGGLLRIVGAAAKVRLEIPKGAVSAPDQLIYMYLQRSPQLDQTAPKYRYSPVVECGPDGLQFNRTVLLTMPHSAADHESLEMFTHGENSEWCGVESQNVTSDHMTAKIIHFSPFLVGAAAPIDKKFDTVVFTTRSQVRFYIMPVSSSELSQSIAQQHDIAIGEHETGFVRRSVWTKFNFQHKKGSLKLRVQQEQTAMVIQEWLFSEDYLLGLTDQTDRTCSVPGYCTSVSVTLQYDQDSNQDDLLVQYQANMNGGRPQLAAAQPEPELQVCLFHDGLGGECTCNMQQLKLPIRRSGRSSGYNSATPRELELYAVEIDFEENE